MKDYDRGGEQRLFRQHPGTSTVPREDFRTAAFRQFGVLACCAVVIQTACSEWPSGDNAFVEVEDSANVQIVTNAKAALAEGSEYTLAETPLLTIGANETAAPPLFGVTDATRPPNGSIAVANGGTSEIFVYDSVGTCLFAFGRHGSGPGEFRSLDWIGLWPGDSIMVYDGGLGRVSIFSSSGEFGRSIRPETADNGSFPDIVGRFVDGTFLARAYNLGRLKVSVTSAIKYSSTFYLYSPTGVQDRKIGNFLNDDIFLLLGQNGRMIERIWMSPPFARRTQIALDQDRFYVGEAERFEIAPYSASGSLVRIIRLANAPRPVTEAAIDQYRQAQLQGAKSEAGKREIERRIAQMPFPETMPAYGKLLVDPARRLWVTSYQAPGERQSHWTVFDSVGVLLGIVKAPDGFDAYEIGLDYVLGRYIEEDTGVELVQVYTLIENTSRKDRSE